MPGYVLLGVEVTPHGPDLGYAEVVLPDDAAASSARVPGLEVYKVIVPADRPGDHRTVCRRPLDTALSARLFPGWRK